MSEVIGGRHSAAHGFTSHHSKFIILSNSPTASPAAASASLGEERADVEAPVRRCDSPEARGAPTLAVIGMEACDDYPQPISQP
jgi:hypothetical protein